METEGARLWEQQQGDCVSPSTFFGQKMPHVYFEDLIDLFLVSFAVKEEPAVIVEQA